MREGRDKVEVVTVVVMVVVVGRAMPPQRRTQGTTRKRTEVDVARVVVVVEELLALDLSRRHPAVLRTRGLNDADGDGEELEELRLDLTHLGEVVNGRADDLTTEKRVEGLSDEEADDGEHGDAAVGHLRQSAAGRDDDGDGDGNGEGDEARARGWHVGV